MDSNFQYASAVNLVIAPLSRPAAWDESDAPFDFPLEGNGFDPVGTWKIIYRFETDVCRLRDGSGLHFFRDGNPIA